ncbi:ribosomal protein S5 domain 2-like protein [Ceraceosorus guamensis]|uniref:phosphomevalonate kinase n=1 Tax=Ceraceosorus guamensis TaxID=1522189 RepID=A0A316W2B0_9BASI|nr:ribosomal protein S5 domain 2-like protein [Ceraceosorus guamensis]PWN43819.1 ribosomal protein S5 domain 2-like protein [Ceraceosorus guamensis]
MSTAATSSTLVSAPGKVLLAGGYLVLDPAYVGVVVATDARFYSLVRCTALDGGDGAPSRSEVGIQIVSPQFLQAEWEFLVKKREAGWTFAQSRESHASASAGPNPFLSLSLLYVLRLALQVLGQDAVERALGSGLQIHVLGDNDFYSQRIEGQSRAPTSAELRALPPFNKQSCIVKDVHKTGLGSSAAMTTSLVGSLMLHLGLVGSGPAPSHTSSFDALKGPREERRLNPTDLGLVHNTAQLVHCAAQGKVGSGFDVSSAVWGSHLYRRFDPIAINHLMDGTKVGAEGEGEVPLRSEADLGKALSPSNKIWQPSPLHSDASTSERGTNPTAVEGLHFSSTASQQTHRPAPLSLPPHISLILADINAGSSTPSLVSKVNAWKKAKPDWAKQLFSILAASNANLADGLLALGLEYGRDAKAYNEAIKLAASQRSKDWDATLRSLPASNVAHTPPSPSSQSSILTLLIEVRNALRSIRAGMRELGQRAGAPIEPDEMGRVLRASTDGADGVLGGGVPGAGGFDALYLLYLDPSPETSSNRHAIEDLWSGWKTDGLCVGPLLCGAVDAGVEQWGALRKALPESNLAGESEEQALSVSGAAQSVDRARESQPGAGFRVERLENVKGLHRAIQRI